MCQALTLHQTEKRKERDKRGMSLLVVTGILPFSESNDKLFLSCRTNNIIKIDKQVFMHQIVTGND